MSFDGFFDLHQHILWGLDDGPQTPDEMYAMLDLADKDGIIRIAATSHAYPSVKPFPLELYQQRLGEANEYCSQQGYALRLIRGCEIHYCERVPDLLAAGKIPTLGDSRLVLIEFGWDVTPEELKRAADCLYRLGFHPIIAHVERYRCIVSSAQRAMRMREEYGLLYQMNCKTVLNPRGIRERRFVRTMLRNEAIDLVATDAHDTVHRPVCMREAYQKLAQQFGGSYVQKLVSFTPESSGKRK